MSLLIGCDTGGTFTDFVIFDPERPEHGLVTAKLSSTPDDPSRAILQGLSELSQGQAVGELCHATTVATNTLLEGTGGRVGYLVTEGFADSLWLGRGDRAELYALQPHRAAPPLSRHEVWEVKERANARGEVTTSLTEQEIERLRREIGDRPGLQALAVCLLHSTLFPEHETALANGLANLGLPVFLSHLMAPHPGEYERGMTTLLAASLAPRIDSYIGRLEADANLRGDLWIVHSAGGLLQPGEARQAPHRLALSGPAAGLRGALSLARACAFDSIITLDMGGTSTDVALCHEGELPYVWETEIQGYPLRSPSLEIHTIGAGGGSIAYRDGGGFLRVGPRSAGADPGPACYGRGGTAPTVTDALCWAGYLPPRLGEDGLRLDRAASESVLAGLAGTLDLSVDQTALGILSIAVSHLGLAVRKVSTGRGHDPQAFTLVPFGGAGPILCCAVAESLEMRSILVPAAAGVLSAWGALTAPWEREWSAPLPPDSRTNEGRIQALLAEVRAQVQPPASLGECTVTPLVARRYEGQGDTIVSSPQQDFHRLHTDRFGFQRYSSPVETVEVKWRCRGPQRILSEASAGGGGGGQPWHPTGERALLREQASAPVLAYTGTLGAGQSQTGPFLHFAAGSTLLVGEGWIAQGLPGSHMILEHQ